MYYLSAGREEEKTQAWVTARKGRGDSGDEKVDEESVCGRSQTKKSLLVVESVLNACFLLRFACCCFLVNVDKRLGFLDKVQFRLLFLGAGGGFGFGICFGIRLWGGGRWGMIIPKYPHDIAMKMGENLA
jgi:hypothetical protein